jgi:hypothetical protein
MSNAGAFPFPLLPTTHRHARLLKLHKLPLTRSTACACSLASRPGITTLIGLLFVSFTLAILAFRLYVRLSPIHYIGGTAGHVVPRYYA